MKAAMMLAVSMCLLSGCDGFEDRPATRPGTHWIGVGDFTLVCNATHEVIGHLWYISPDWNAYSMSIESLVGLNKYYPDKELAAQALYDFSIANNRCKP